MSQKRILRELVLLKELIEEHKLNFSVYQIGHESIINKLGLFSKSNILLLEINLNHSYPFQVRKLMVRYKNKFYTNNEIYNTRYISYSLWSSKIIKQNDNNEKLLNAYIFTHINIQNNKIRYGVFA